MLNWWTIADILLIYPNEDQNKRMRQRDETMSATNVDHGSETHPR